MSACLGCGASLPFTSKAGQSKRRDATTCSPRCQKQTYRERLRAEGAVTSAIWQNKPGGRRKNQSSLPGPASGQSGAPGEQPNEDASTPTPAPHRPRCPRCGGRLVIEDVAGLSPADRDRLEAACLACGWRGYQSAPDRATPPRNVAMAEAQLLWGK